MREISNKHCKEATLDTDKLLPPTDKSLPPKTTTMTSAIKNQDKISMEVVEGGDKVEGEEEVIDIAEGEIKDKQYVTGESPARSTAPPSSAKWTKEEDGSANNKRKIDELWDVAHISPMEEEKVECCNDRCSGLAVATWTSNLHPEHKQDL